MEKPLVQYEYMLAPRPHFVAEDCTLLFNTGDLESIAMNCMVRVAAVLPRADTKEIDNVESMITEIQEVLSGDWRCRSRGETSAKLLTYPRNIRDAGDVYINNLPQRVNQTIKTLTGSIPLKENLIVNVHKGIATRNCNAHWAPRENVWRRGS